MRILLILLFLWASGSMAQTFPLYEQITVNDYADLLPVDEEAALSAQLKTLREETGVEMTVLTLDSQRPFAQGQSLEAFSTALFNHWGIGDAQRNDGVLVMVLRADRAMRVELGAGYGQDWNREAQYIVDNDFLPAFRSDDYAGGITRGVDAVIEDIVMPFNEGAPRPARQAENSRGVKFLFGIVGGAFAAFAALFVFAKRMIKRLRKCPNCGRGGMNKDRIVDFKPSFSTTGSGRHHFHCDHCDHSYDQGFIIAMRSHSTSSGSSSGSSFGGGSSGGGGASGRW
ncbi:TPM domain-containing protein [Octadecabacter sp. CECT 8868]|uniref:TPM domain-containing protein n=1 Tax=Octadecabacter algicola TaxID=2909342 RepID=UPI001F2F80AC|nr:TPM domain-containing protein [Octadecabacter algicola]MCF2905336.1 TPM domain-containing protein [Octadecabacter algicola]